MADHDDDGAKLALLAHDLRTPLSAMRLTAELIGNGPLDSRQSEQLSILIRSIDALSEMTGALVNAAAPGSSGRQAGSRVAEIVSDCSGLFKIAAEARGLSFSVTIDDAMSGYLTLGGNAVRRILAALLDNAIKYTGKGGIAVSLTRVPEDDAAAAEDREVWLSLSVADSGPGIDAVERERLFRPFVRGRHGRETGSGTGLGLWGAAQLAEEIGGSLTLESPGSGGSRFEVRIPVYLHEENLRNAESLPDQGMKHSLPAHVLIVDDNDTNCRLLAALLESFGITSEIVHSGEEAILLARQNAYDAVLLDLHMPGMSGVETAERLKGLGLRRDLPLVAVSAATDAVGGERLRQAGFQDVLAKPLAPADLYQAMRRIHRASSGNRHDS